jgi:hypothetical protein
MTSFNKRFLTILEQDDTLSAPLDAVGEDPSPDLGLDPGSDPAMFDEEVPDNPIGDLQDEQREGTITTLEKWIEEVGSFVEILNGLDEGSMNSQINKANCDSIMADVQRSESKKISRSAAELSALRESLKQYLLVARQKGTSAQEI